MLRKLMKANYILLFLATIGSMADTSQNIESDNIDEVDVYEVEDCSDYPDTYCDTITDDQELNDELDEFLEKHGVYYIDIHPGLRIWLFDDEKVIFIYTKSK